MTAGPGTTGSAAERPVAGPADTSGAFTGPKAAEVVRVMDTLTQLAEDSTVPRNIRRGAQAAREELSKNRSALDVRIASAVYVLDDLANDPNLPTHGRTAIWSIISTLESLQ